MRTCGADAAASNASAVMATYRTPQLLKDVRLLDLIELSGSTVRAAPLLNMSQPSVSRRRQRLAAELDLVPTEHLRQGDGACLRLLRRSAKCHRLQAGVWRLGGDGWCIDPALVDDSTLLAPQRFAPWQQWQALVAGHVLDGALVSGHELQQAEPDQPLVLGNCVALPLLRLPLTLLGRVETLQTASPVVPAWSRVLMPPLPSCGGLAMALRQQQLLPSHLRAEQRQADAWLAVMEQKGALALATPLWQRQLQRHACTTLQPFALSKPLDLDVWLMVHRRDWAKTPRLHSLATGWAALITQCMAEA